MTVISTKSRANLISGLVFGLGAGMFVWLAWLQGYRYAHAPDYPDLALGLVVPQSNHGFIRYFSAFQDRAVHLVPVPIPFIILGLYLSPKQNVAGRIGWLGGRVTWDADDPRHIFKVAAAFGAFAGISGVVFLCAPLLHWLMGV